jgi:hypothetical protein
MFKCIYILYTRPITGKQLDQNGFWRTELYILYSIQRPEAGHIYKYILLIFFLYIICILRRHYYMGKVSRVWGGGGAAVRNWNLGPTYLATGGISHKYGTPHPMS